jgi:hypothetical protein
MPELVRMRALRPWRNDQEEKGYVDVGQIFFATIRRAQDLEENGLAVRFLEGTARVVVHEDPAWGLSARPAPRKR